MPIATPKQYREMLNAAQKVTYNRENDFSLVITIKENPVKNMNTNRLYNDLIEINNLEAITTVDLELNAESTA